MTVIAIVPRVSTPSVVTRGTTNGAVRGNSEDRRRRRAWLMTVYASIWPGYVLCYRCGVKLFNQDDVPVDLDPTALRLSIDRIVPGVAGGGYRRNNIRPACLPCNSSTGGALAGQRP